MTRNEKLFDKALTAVTELFYDDPETARYNIKRLQDELTIMLASLEP